MEKNFITILSDFEILIWQFFSESERFKKNSTAWRSWILFVAMEIMELCQPIPGAGLGASNTSLPAMFMGTLDGGTLDRNYSDVTANRSLIEDAMTGFMVGGHNGKIFVFFFLKKNQLIFVLPYENERVLFTN